jgi:hypothetical protein
MLQTSNDKPKTINRSEDNKTDLSAIKLQALSQGDSHYRVLNIS